MGARLFTQRDPLPGPAQSAREPASGAARRGREAAALVLFAVSVFLCLALAGLRKDPAIPALSGADWVGPVGAAVAGFLAEGFGLVAWLAPLELVLVAAPMFWGRRETALGIRLAGDLVLAIVLAALVQVAAPELLVFGRLRAGGNVGLLFGELMRGLFSSLGSFLVGSTVAGLIIVTRSSFSFTACLRWAARFSRRALERLVALCRKLGVAWKQARQLRAERRQAERAAGLPRIETKPSDEAIIAKLQQEDESEWLDTDAAEPAPLALSSELTGGASSAASMLVDSATTPEPSAASHSPGAEPTDASTSAPASAELVEHEEPASDEPSDAARCAAARCASAEPGSAAEPAGATAAAQASSESHRAGRPRIVDTRPAQKVQRSRRASRARRSESFELPPTRLLKRAPPAMGEEDEEKLLHNAELLIKTLADYGIAGSVKQIYSGPTVTTYEVAPEAGTKVSKVANLVDDLALGLSRKVRIIAPIPGKSRIGFELPNDRRNMVYLRELVEDKRFVQLAQKVPLPVVLGRDIIGKPFFADLASLPHLIVAGATGSGKSVGLNVMLASLLFCRSPEQLRLLMIDPKVVELAPYHGIPHMLLPVVTDMKQAATALRWAVDEMERRYQLFADAGTKNITTYNKWVDRVAAGEVPAPEASRVTALSAEGAVVSVPATKDGSDGVRAPGKLPYIVVVVDEFSDLMMQAGRDVEASVARLAQKARAAGIHVVLATQRPSVDVITGMIKANFTSRIAYRTAQKTDSRTILDGQGAELLLGKGDMLVKSHGASEVRRVQCPFIDEEEVAALTDFLRQQGSPQYHEAILAAGDEEAGEEDPEEAVDPRYDEALRIVAETQRCSTSWLQRRMTVGYNRAAKMVEMMEKQGVVGPPNGARDREVLVFPL